MSRGINHPTKFYCKMKDSKEPNTISASAMRAARDVPLNASQLLYKSKVKDIKDIIQDKSELEVLRNEVPKLRQYL